MDRILRFAISNHRIARPFGINVGVHGTLIVLIGLLTLADLFGAGLFAASVTLLFATIAFTSVALHELGHALTARFFGVGTRAITLLPIGGVAMLNGDLRTPRQEIAVALAGPLVNIAIAAALALTERVLGVVLPSTALIFELLSLAIYVNLALALFNLIPAFPMDGGRVLRALLAGRIGRLRATRIAAQLGVALAAVLFVAGFVGNPTLIFIAIFVYFSAKAELAAVEAQHRTFAEPFDIYFRRPSDFGPRPIYVRYLVPVTRREY